MPDAKDFAPNNPVHLKESPEPKYKTLSFHGDIEDFHGDWYEYIFTGNYYEFDGAIRFVEAKMRTALRRIVQEELQNILRIDIREELNTDYSIIFETQIELK